MDYRITLVVGNIVTDHKNRLKTMEIVFIKLYLKFNGD
jgi:hypothetical protein